MILFDKNDPHIFKTRRMTILDKNASIKLFAPISYKPLFKIIILSYSIVYIYMWNSNLETTDFSLCLSFFIFKHNCSGRIEKKNTRKTNGSVEKK